MDALISNSFTEKRQLPTAAMDYCVWRWPDFRERREEGASSIIVENRHSDSSTQLDLIWRKQLSIISIIFFWIGNPLPQNSQTSTKKLLVSSDYSFENLYIQQLPKRSRERSNRKRLYSKSNPRHNQNWICIERSWIARSCYDINGRFLNYFHMLHKEKFALI